MRASLRAFLSSTWEDLQVERATVTSAIARMEGIVLVGMEHFGSRNENPQGVSLFEVGKCEIYVGIIANCYGSGITHKEYRHAHSRGMYCLIYIKDETAPVPPSFIETIPERVKKLLVFKEELRRNHVVSTFFTPEKLAADVQADLHNLMTREFIGEDASANKIATEAQHVQIVRQSSEEIAAILMGEQWLGLRVVSQLRSEPNLSAIELETRLGVELDLLMAILARLTRSGIIDISGSRFFCTDKGIEILYNVEKALAARNF